MFHNSAKSPPEAHEPLAQRGVLGRLGAVLDRPARPRPRLNDPSDHAVIRHQPSAKKMADRLAEKKNILVF